MTALRDRPAPPREQVTWKMQGVLIEWDGADERQALHELHPRRQALVERCRRHGIRLPARLVPRVGGDDLARLGAVPRHVWSWEDNLLVNAGINRVESLLIAGGGQAYDNTHSRLQVGDGTGSVPTAAATDTDLAAAVNASNRWGQMADSTYPTQGTQVITWQFTVPTSNANFEWREWGIDQGTASAVAAATAPLMNHKGVDLGAKTSAVAWTFRPTLTLS